MEAQFLDHNNSGLKQQRRLPQREMEKSKWFISEKQLRTCITLLCTFLSRRCMIATWIPNYPLYEVGEHNSKIFFFFS